MSNEISRHKHTFILPCFFILIVIWACPLGNTLTDLENVIYSLVFTPISATSNLKGFSGPIECDLTLSQTTNFRLFQAERDHNFKIDENYREFFKWVENTVGKIEIARYEQFLLIPQCF